jgi:Peptidase family M23/D-alanyl-D-alanine carboxypeptidase
MNVVDPVAIRLRAYGGVLDAEVPSHESRAVHSVEVGHTPRRVRFVVAGIAASVLVVIVGLVRVSSHNLADPNFDVATAPIMVPVVPPGLDTVFPVVGVSTYVDTFGAPRMSGTEYAHAHRGVDIFAALGSPVRAMRGGTISHLGAAKLGGNRLWITDADGSKYYYAHLQRFAEGLKNGSVVQLGQALGAVGTSGNAPGTPAHLHVEVHLNATQPVNPFPLLQAIQELDLDPRDTESVEGITVRKSVAAPLRLLLTAAKDAGFVLGGVGYRSPAAQIALRRAHCGTSPVAVYLADASSCHPPTARPGKSRHEIGGAVDFTISASPLKAGSAAFVWLLANARRFGFVTVEGEPWHWEHHD